MDYKLELIECDEMIEVALLSNEELVAARAAISNSPQVDESVRNAYARARNVEFRPSLARVVGDAPRGEPLVATLSTTRVGGG
jgi:hypothetical protein